MGKDWSFLYEKYVKREHTPKTYERSVQSVMQNASGVLFVDIGANLGIYTRSLADRFSHVIAFEPNPRVAVKLREKTKDLKNVQIEEVALSDREGSAPFYRSLNPGGEADTMLPLFEYRPDHRDKYRAYPDGTYYGTNPIMVKTSTYDKMLGDEHADYVKMDVEGLEFEVLRGMEESIEAGRVERLLVELHNRDRKKELVKLLGRFYRLNWLDGEHLFARLRPYPTPILWYTLPNPRLKE